jgi:hypothetical protein
VLQHHFFDIPRMSFRAHLAGTIISRKRGAAPVFSKAEEYQLVQYVITMQDLGFPLTIQQLKMKVAMITQGRDTYVATHDRVFPYYVPNSSINTVKVTLKIVPKRFCEV